MITDQSLAFEARELSCYYKTTAVIQRLSLKIPRLGVTALIGPSGCGKSTLLRTFNRMNDFIAAYHHDGAVFFEGNNLYHASSDATAIRRRIGMVFQKPNPFASSIAKNITWAPKIHGYRGNLDDLVEDCLRKAALWDEVKDKLDTSGLALSGGQQQRLCIARAIAMNPEAILMDEPCSALDPKSTLAIESLISELKLSYTIVIVTHNMQQAARISDQTAFLFGGKLVEFGSTAQVFADPEAELTRDYIFGRFG